MLPGRAPCVPLLAGSNRALNVWSSPQTSEAKPWWVGYCGVRCRGEAGEPKAGESRGRVCHSSGLQDSTRGVQRSALRTDLGTRGSGACHCGVMQPLRRPSWCFCLIQPLQSMMGTQRQREGLQGLQETLYGSGLQGSRASNLLSNI